jgi:hypothetical protein
MQITTKPINYAGNLSRSTIGIDTEDKLIISRLFSTKLKTEPFKGRHIDGDTYLIYNCTQGECDYIIYYGQNRITGHYKSPSNIRAVQTPKFDPDDPFRALERDFADARDMERKHRS